MLTHVWVEDATSKPESTETSTEERFPVATNDLLLPESNFYPWSIITAQYGIFEYILLSPAKDDANNITSEDEAQMILSAINIATTNAEWYVSCIHFTFHALFISARFQFYSIMDLQIEYFTLVRFKMRIFKPVLKLFIPIVLFRNINVSVA